MIQEQKPISELENSVTALQNFWVQEIQNKEEQGHSYIPNKGEFRASMLPYCGRKNILRKNPDWIEFEVIEEKINRPVPLGSNVAGQAIHEFIQDKLLKGNNKLITKEPYVSRYYKGVKIEGHIDLIIQLGTAVIVDIKSFKRSERYEAERYLPNEHHLNQLSLYLWMFGLTEGFLLYVNRDNFEPLFYKLSDYDDRITRMLTKALHLFQCEYLEELPERLPKEYNSYKNIEELNWECRYCEFQKFCFSEV